MFINVFRANDKFVHPGGSYTCVFGTLNLQGPALVDQRGLSFISAFYTKKIILNIREL